MTKAACADEAALAPQARVLPAQTLAALCAALPLRADGARPDPGWRQLVQQGELRRLRAARLAKLPPLAVPWVPPGDRPAPPAGG